VGLVTSCPSPSIRIEWQMLVFAAMGIP